MPIKVEDLDHLKLTHKSLIPNVTTLGYFLDSIQVICLPAVCMGDVEETSGEFVPEAHSKVYPLLCHELRHWFDFISTLWGQKQLALLFNAINSRINNNPEIFSPIIQYTRAQKKAFLVDYFTTQTNDPDILLDRGPWKINRTIGHRFGVNGELLKDKNILFANFATQKDEFIGRSPISISSLLESNAMYAEMTMHRKILSTIPEQEKTEYYISNILPYFDQFEYSPEMRTYSVAAHIVANKIHIEDTFSALTIASGLATLALNISVDNYRIMKKAEVFSNNIDNDFRTEHDEAYAFMTFVENMSDNVQDMTKAAFITNILSSSNLPDFNQITKSTLKQMLSIEDSIIDGPFKMYLSSLLDYGRKLFELRGPFGYDFLEIDALGEKKFIPPIVLRDNNLWIIQSENEEFLWENFEARCSIINQILEQIEEFDNACGV